MSELLGWAGGAGESMSRLLGNITSVKTVDLHCSMPHPSARTANGKASHNYSAAGKLQWMKYTRLLLFLTRKGVNEILNSSLLWITSGNLIM